MFSFNKLLKTVLVAMACASITAAAPWPSSAKHETHRVRLVGRNSLKLETFHPASTFEVNLDDFLLFVILISPQTFGTEGLAHPLARRDGFDLESAATAFVQSKLGVDSDAVNIQSSFVNNVAKHAFVKQQSVRTSSRISGLPSYNVIQSGVPFANAVANVVFNNDGKVTSFGSSFVSPCEHNCHTQRFLSDSYCQLPLPTRHRVSLSKMLSRRPRRHSEAK
jgi:extracellular elastinolytic metalloproteinase